jgi:hypothetical protein
MQAVSTLELSAVRSPPPGTSKTVGLDVIASIYDGQNRMILHTLRSLDRDHSTLNVQSSIAPPAARVEHVLQYTAIRLLILESIRDTSHLI